MNGQTRPFYSGGIGCRAWMSVVLGNKQEQGFLPEKQTGNQALNSLVNPKG